MSNIVENYKLDTLYQFKTPYNADSVEWCPHKPFQNVFVCANYQLCEETSESNRKRVGNILVFSIDYTKGLLLHQTVKTAAVLDQKWCPNHIMGFSILGIVNAEGRIEIYKLVYEGDGPKLELITSVGIGGEGEVLLLSLDWSTGKYPSQEPYIICSDSKGSWHRFVFQNNTLVLCGTSQAHKFEAWISAYYYWDSNIFFTGGDDSLFLKFDLKTGTEPILRNKAHEAGVTSIHSNAEKEYTLVTGSYDEFLRLWDIRNMKTAVRFLKMPGPLWRVKWDPFSHQSILVACMLGGAHIVNMLDSDDLQISAGYMEHKSITYGADWCYLSENTVKAFDCCNIIATCSFYDNLLCISKLVT